jgi:hypothetical protein
MVHMMLFAFFRTGIADIGAKLANSIGMRAAKAHQVRRRAANSSAFQVEPDAMCHHLHVFFLQAGGSAVVTYGHTIEASFDAGSVSLVHIRLLMVISYFTHTTAGSPVLWHL